MMHFLWQSLFLSNTIEHQFYLSMDCFHTICQWTCQKTLSSSYTKLQVSHPYLLLGDDQYTLLNKDFDGQVVQYDHMYIQQEPLLLFWRTDKNCYINIIEHAPAKTITPTCTFLYYHKITVHASLVTTNHFWILWHQSEYSQGWFLTFLDVAFECPAPEVGHLKSP